MLGFPGVMNPIDTNKIYSESVGYHPMRVALVVCPLVLLRYTALFRKCDTSLIAVRIGLERRNIINE